MTWSSKQCVICRSRCAMYTVNSYLLLHIYCILTFNVIFVLYMRSYFEIKSEDSLGLNIEMRNDVVILYNIKMRLLPTEENIPYKFIYILCMGCNYFIIFNILWRFWDKYWELRTKIEKCFSNVHAYKNVCISNFQQLFGKCLEGKGTWNFWNLEFKKRIRNDYPHDEL